MGQNNPHTVADLGDPGRGFMEPGEWGPKPPGSQGQDAKMNREQGAEESNLGSMEHWVCHKIMVFYFFNTHIHQFYISGLILKRSFTVVYQ